MAAPTTATSEVAPATMTKKAEALPADAAPEMTASKYRCLVLDSGPIIKLTGISSLQDRAEHVYTVPAVLAEIRDAKARQHLQTLPFDLRMRVPDSASISAVTEFARLPRTATERSRSSCCARRRLMLLMGR